jgi:hypothetical protein
MKKTSTIRIEGFFPLLVLSFVGMTFGGCATKIAFETSTVEPAAVGKVKIKKDRNHNYTMEVDVLHLGSPKRLTPAKDVYVVWVETPENSYKNVGRITTGTSMFSKALTGSLTTVLLYQPRKVFITAEPEGGLEQPGEPVVLTTSSF